MRTRSWALTFLLFAAPAFAWNEPPTASPTTLSNYGGTQVYVSGSYFYPPVRAFFDFTDGTSKEAFVFFVTTYGLSLISPQVDLPFGGKKEARLTLAFGAGTPNENRVTVDAKFSFETPVRTTPKILTISPRSGPLTGGTRVSIFGEGFQMPVQVMFGDEPAQVVAVMPTQIVLVAPGGRAIGKAAVHVTNVNWDETSAETALYEYRSPATLSAVSPASGSTRGGTRIRISGSGFQEPVAVTVAGVAAQVIAVTPSEIIAITSPVVTTDCGNRGGDVQIINVDDGEMSGGVQFTYFVDHPAFTSIPRVLNAGRSADITVANGDIDSRFTLGNTAIKPASVRVDGNGAVTFTFKVPDLVPPSASCADTSFKTSLAYKSLLTGCDLYTLVDFQPASGRDCPGAEPPRRGPQ